MPLDIPAHDHGKVYVFDIDETAAARPVHQLLGTTALNHDYVDMVTLEDLPDSGGLAWYLHEGYGLTASPEETLSLAAIPTHALLVMSRAFDGTEVGVNPSAGVRHALTLSAPQPKPTVPLTGTSDGKLQPIINMAEPERSSRIWIYALTVTFGIFALMAWRIASGNV